MWSTKNVILDSTGSSLSRLFPYEFDLFFFLGGEGDDCAFTEMTL